MQKTRIVIALFLMLLWSNIGVVLSADQTATTTVAPNDTICSNTTYPINHIDLFAEVDTLTTYQLEYFHLLLCQSLQMNLTVAPNAIPLLVYDTICAGETYTWNGNTYTKPGSYTKTLQNIYGCDSIVTLHLEVNPTYEVHDTVVACDSYTFAPFNKNGGV